MHRILRPSGKISRTLCRLIERSFYAREHHRSASCGFCVDSDVRHSRIAPCVVDFVSGHSTSLVVCFIFALLASVCVVSQSAFGQISSVSFETPYNHITIERNGSIVEMRSFWRSKLYRESAVDLNDPARLMVPYTVSIAASAIFRPNSKRVLMIGLGGGGFNQFFERAFPSATLETVELDPQSLC